MRGGAGRGGLSAAAIAPISFANVSAERSCFRTAEPTRWARSASCRLSAPETSRLSRHVAGAQQISPDRERSLVADRPRRALSARPGGRDGALPRERGARCERHLQAFVAADEVRRSVRRLGCRRRGAGRAGGRAGGRTRRAARGGRGWRRGRSACRTRRRRGRSACRSMSNRNGSAKTSSSRLADGYSSRSFSPSRICLPWNSTSRVAVRAMFLIGLTHRSISSIADGRSAAVGHERGPSGRARRAAGRRRR